MLTTYADDESILRALRAGARGYLTKDAGRSEIARAIEAAAAGQSVLDPAVQERLLAVAADPGAPAPDSAQPPPDGLTAREVEVLTLIAGGLSNAQIAKTLFVTEATVKTHVNHIFAKAGVRDRAQAVRYAYEQRPRLKNQTGSGAARRGLTPVAGSDPTWRLAYPWGSPAVRRIPRSPAVDRGRPAGVDSPHG